MTHANGTEPNDYGVTSLVQRQAIGPISLD